MEWHYGTNDAHITYCLFPITGKDIEETLKRFRSVDFMAGFNTGEGSLILSQLKRLAKEGGYSFTDGVNHIALETFLNDYLSDYFPNNYAAVKAQIEKLYFLEGISKPATEYQALGVINAFTDLVFAAPAVALLDAHSKDNFRGKTYFYIFNHITQDSKKELPPW